MNPDLIKERAEASKSVNVSALTAFLYTDEERRLRAKFRAMVAKDPVLQIQNNMEKMNRKEQLAAVMRVDSHIIKQKEKLGLSHVGLDPKNPASPSPFSIYRQEAKVITSGLMLHEIAFLPFIRAQLADWQQQPWVRLAEQYKILGCYCQTELGHGSNVRGLETTATYIPSTDQLELHSPTLASIKWWPGNLGAVANVAIVMAQLIVGGKNLGVHAFLVQLRSFTDHKPLLGIEIGDIGSKMATNTIDNGWLRFTRHRIARTNMLMRFQQLDENGAYTQAPHAKLAYTGMISVRADIVRQSFYALAAGCTIGVRYSLVRRQFALKNGEAERQVLDYAMQQYRVLPYIACAYAFKCTSAWLTEQFEAMQARLARGDMKALDALPEVHAASAGLKSFCSNVAAEGIESCRRACGGHGYLNNGGLALMSAAYVGVVTAEGENYLLTQQTARYLLKMYQRSMMGKQLKGVAATLLGNAVSHEPLPRDADVSRVETLKAALGHRVYSLLQSIASATQEEIANGRDVIEAAVYMQVDLSRLSAAFCQYLVLDCIVRAASSAVDATVRDNLLSMSRLFGLYWIEREYGDYLVDSYLSAAHVASIRRHLRAVLAATRVSAINLVDAFDFSDFQLQSALGRYDGNAYEALYERSKLSTLNGDSIRRDVLKNYGSRFRQAKL